MNDDDEILDLVDETDKVIGQIRRGDIESLTEHGGKYVRAVDLFIIRSDGKIWVPIRSLHKRIAPGGLDYSVGGHVLSGDTYEETIIRELAEEASITIDSSELEFVANCPPDARHISPLYILRTDTQPVLSSEHSSGEWLTLQEIKSRLQSGTPAKVSLLPKLLLLEEYLNKARIS